MTRSSVHHAGPIEQTRHRVSVYDKVDRSVKSPHSRRQRTRMSVGSESSRQEPVLPRVAAGEAGAVEEFMDRYSGLVWTLTRRMCADRHAAEDVVQDIFVDIWRHASRFDPSLGSEATFVATITRRRLIDALRKKKRQLAGPPIDESGGVVAVEQTNVAGRPMLSEEAEIARQVLSELSEDQQRVLQLSIFHGQSHERIAEATGLPLGTVKTHARRGLIRVREALAKTSRRQGLTGVSS